MNIWTKSADTSKLFSVLAEKCHYPSAILLKMVSSSVYGSLSRHAVCASIIMPLRPVKNGEMMSSMACCAILFLSQGW